MDKQYPAKWQSKYNNITGGSNEETISEIDQPKEPKTSLLSRIKAYILNIFDQHPN